MIGLIEASGDRPRAGLRWPRVLEKLPGKFARPLAAFSSPLTLKLSPHTGFPLATEIFPIKLRSMQTFVRVVVFFASLASAVWAQSINSGTVSGTITDQSGGVIVGAKVNLRSPISGYDQTQTSDTSGQFRFNTIPQNNYRLTVTQPGFASLVQALEVRSSVPQALKLSLQVKETATTVDVESGTEAIS